ncbi:MAG: 50S ribosomal protein L21 [Opitutales bacterium]
MKATIQTQGRQLTVSEGDILKLNRFTGTDQGAMVEVTDVLAVIDGANTRFGTPTVDGAKVEFEVLENKKDKKIEITKKKRRQGYRRHAGHRQQISVVRVKAINA